MPYNLITYMVEVIKTEKILEQIFQRVIRIVGREDNAAAFLAIRRGYSRKLAHMAKHHKVSLSALHEVFYGDPNVVGEIKEHEYNTLLQEPTETQRSDILTKPVAPGRHWELISLLYMAYRGM